MKTDSYTNRTQSMEVDKGCNRNLIKKTQLHWQRCSIVLKKNLTDFDPLAIDAHCDKLKCRAVEHEIAKCGKLFCIFEYSYKYDLHVI